MGESQRNLRESWRKWENVRGNGRKSDKIRETKGKFYKLKVDKRKRHQYFRRKSEKIRGAVVN